MLYLYLLRRGQAPTAVLMQRILNEYRQRFGEVTMLGGQLHTGSLPSDPDTFVVMTCLMVCEQKGIQFDSKRDQIIYSIDMLDGESIGVCRINVNTPVNVKTPVKSGCFIATATCGSTSASQVIFLQNFRDLILLKSAFGRIIVSIYEMFSPRVASQVAKYPVLCYLIRVTFIDPLIRVIHLLHIM